MPEAEPQLLQYPVVTKHPRSEMLVMGYVDLLPGIGIGWERAKMDRWLRGFKQMLEYLYDIPDEPDGE
jgi:hypothetical protein